MILFDPKGSEQPFLIVHHYFTGHHCARYNTQDGNKSMPDIKRMVEGHPREVET